MHIYKQNCTYQAQLFYFFRYDFSLLLASSPRHLVIHGKPGNMAGNSREKTNPITELIQHEREICQARCNIALFHDLTKGGLLYFRHHDEMGSSQHFLIQMTAYTGRSMSRKKKD